MTTDGADVPFEHGYARTRRIPHPVVVRAEPRMRRGGYFCSTRANLWAAFAHEQSPCWQAAADGRTRVTYNGETKEVVWDMAITEGEAV